MGSQSSQCRSVSIPCAARVPYTRSLRCQPISPLFLIFLPQFVPEVARPTRDWPEYRKGDPKAMTIFDNSFQNGWYDSSWNTWVQPLNDSIASGAMGSAAVCGKVPKGVRHLARAVGL